MSQKVLLADSSMTIQKLVELTLTKEGYAVSIAEDGNSALQMAKKLNPNIFLIESQLKGIDGYEVSRILRKEYGFGDSLILMLVGPAESFDKIRGEIVSGYLKKPFESIEILEKIKEHLAGDKKRVEKVVNRLPSEKFELTEVVQEPPNKESSNLTNGSRERYLEPMEGELESIGKEEGNWILSSSSSLFREKEEDGISKIFDDIILAPEEGEVKYIGDDSPASFSDRHPTSTTGDIQEEIGKKIGELPREYLEGIIARVAKDMVEKVAWEVIPSLAEIAIRKEIERLKAEDPE